LGIIELLFIAVGLSADAFSVAVCSGMGMRGLRWGSAVIESAFFGGFQALMPLLGWFLGKRFETYIDAYGGWVAFALLSLIGGKMIFDALFKKENGGDPGDGSIKIKELLLLSFATSIDAFAAGVAFAAVGAEIVRSVTVIGATTFTLSFFGVILGNRFGGVLKGKAGIVGGAVLIIIGVTQLF
jgi:putative Mn2+ efflux pump MntP